MSGLAAPMIEVSASELVDAAKPSTPHAATDAVVVAVGIGRNRSVSGQGHDPLPWRVVLIMVAWRSSWRTGEFLSLGSESSEKRVASCVCAAAENEGRRKVRKGGGE